MQVAGCQLTDASLSPQPTGCFWQDGVDANQTLVLQKQLQNSQAAVQQLTTQKADFQAIVDKQVRSPTRLCMGL